MALLRRRTLVPALLIGVLVLLLAGSSGGVGGAPSAANFTRDPSPETFSGVTGYVYGNTNDYAPTAALADATVSVYDQCISLPDMDCTLVASTSTNASGFFGVDLSPGSGYYVVVSPDASPAPAAFEGFGGDVQGFTAPTTSPLSLQVYPYVGYGNASIVLPGYNCMAAYLNNLGGAGPGCQNPILSWTQDGAFYVNASNELVFYSFANRTVYRIAAWIPLYQTFPDYAMISNELFATQDGAYLYSWGEESASNATLTVEAVNVTTGRVFLYNYTEVNADDATTNAELMLTGWDGNDSQAVLIVEGELFDHDLWSDTESFVGTAPYFEANNMYWVPFLNGWVNVEADGTSGDYLQEYQLTGPVTSSVDYLLVQTYSSPWTDQSIVVNGVNGISFNVSSRQLSVQPENSGLVYSVLPNGTIDQLLEVTNYERDSSCGCAALGPVSASDRSLLIASGPELSHNYNGYVNDSWLIDMTPGHIGYYATNQSPWVYNPTVASGQVYSEQAWYQEGQFVNASYTITADSYGCNAVLPGSCTIDGGGGAAVGTISWLWKLGLPEFPYPASNPIANAESPAATSLTGITVAGTSATITWRPITNDAILNYTVTWGTSPDDLSDSASVVGSTDTFTISGLALSTRYYVAVEAWNLHYHGASSGVSSFFVPPEATDVHVTGSNETNLSLAWTNPPAGTFTNLSLQFGDSPEALNGQESVGVVSAVTVAGLRPGTAYYFTVTAWNGTVEEGTSPIVSGSTTFPGAQSLAVIGTGVTNISLAWTNPAVGTFSNVSVEYGTTPGGLTVHASVGTVSSFDATGLKMSTAYYFVVVVWNGTIGGAPSNLASGRTLFPGATYLTVTGTTSQSVSLAWTNPAPATYTNLTVVFGTSEGALTERISVGPVSSYIVSGLSPSTTYYFAVVVWNGTEIGAPSNEVTAATSGTGLTSSSTGLSALDWALIGVVVLLGVIVVVLALRHRPGPPPSVDPGAGARHGPPASGPPGGAV